MHDTLFMLVARHYAVRSASADASYLFKFTEAQLNELVIPGDCVNLIMEYLHWIDLQEYKNHVKEIYIELQSDPRLVYYGYDHRRVPGRFGYDYLYETIEMNVWRHTWNSGVSKYLKVAEISYNHVHCSLYTDDGIRLIPEYSAEREKHYFRKVPKTKYANLFD